MCGLTSLPCPGNLMSFSTTYVCRSAALWEPQLLISEYCLVLPCLPCVRGWCLAFLCPGSPEPFPAPHMLGAHRSAPSPCYITHSGLWQPCGSPEGSPGCGWAGQGTGLRWAGLASTPSHGTACIQHCSCGIFTEHLLHSLIREAPTPPRGFTHDSPLGCHLLAPSALLPSQLCQGEMVT